MSTSTYMHACMVTWAYFTHITCLGTSNACIYMYIYKYIYTHTYITYIKGYLSIHRAHHMFCDTICLIMPFSETSRVQYPRSAVFWIRGQARKKYVPTCLCGMLKSIDVRPVCICAYGCRCVCASVHASCVCVCAHMPLWLVEERQCAACLHMYIWVCVCVYTCLCGLLACIYTYLHVCVYS
jgi:hypothetical protein